MMSFLRTIAHRDEGTGALGRHGTLLTSLILLLVALPIAQMFSGSTPRFTILLTLVLVSAIVVNSHQRWIFTVAGVVGVAAIAVIFVAELTNSSPARMS